MSQRRWDARDEGEPRALDQPLRARALPAQSGSRSRGEAGRSAPSGARRPSEGGRSPPPSVQSPPPSVQSPPPSPMKTVGVDVGSTTVKAVVVEDGKAAWQDY